MRIVALTTGIRPIHYPKYI